MTLFNPVNYGENGVVVSGSNTNQNKGPIKVVVVSDRVYPYFKGGAEKRYWEIAKNLDKDKFKVTFITGQWPGMKKEEVHEGIRLLGVYKVGKFYVDGHKSILETIKYSLSIFRYLLLEEYDLIECEQFPILPIFTCKVVTALKKKPLIVTWHEVWGKTLWKEYIGICGFVGAFLESISVHLADKIISVSPHTTEKLISMYHLQRDRIVTIPNGLDLNWDRRRWRENESKYLPERRHPIEPSDVIYVGRLLNHKHIDHLQQVISVAKKSIPDIYCLIVGDGPERDTLQEIAINLGLQENVRFVGFLENERQVYSLMKASRVFVLPSIREGFGITVIEANSCGLPVLVVRHKDNAACDLIRSGHNGYVCEQNTREIAEKILEILATPASVYSEVCKRMSYAYSWTEITRKVIAVYFNLLKPRERRNLVPETE